MLEPPEQRPRKRRGCWFAAALFLVLLTIGGYYAFRVAWEAANMMACSQNLLQITMATHNYAQFYHSLPPAYTVDDNGRPLHSWRVLILPFMELGDLYNKLRLNERWDSPYNNKVLQKERVPQVYHCPSATSPEDETSYVMIVGPGTISDGPHSARFGDIKDGMSKTILFAEIKNSGIHWAEPRDLDFKAMSFHVNDPNGRGISSYHSGGAGVRLGDASGRFLENGIDPKLLKALITINGGEDVSEFVNR
jgi:hypothetical protein